MPSSVEYRVYVWQSFLLFASVGYVGKVLLMKKTLFFKQTLPLYLCIVLLIVMLVTIVTQVKSYGLTTDEGMQSNYGQAVFAWYRTLGKDQSFLHFPADSHEPEHGPLFVTIVAAAEHILHQRWNVEAALIALSGVLGVIALGLCGFELGGWWFALLAALSLWLYPRFSGAIFNNPKDIPFTTATILVLWSTLLLIKQWGQDRKYLRNSLLVAFFIAVAVAIRVNAITWYATLALITAGWWLLNWRRVLREKQVAQAIGQQALSTGIIGMGSLLGILAMWPYILLNPLVNFYRALTVIAKYPWNGSVLFEGTMQLAVDLPRSYALTWLVIGSPPALLLCAIVGCLFLGGWSLRKRVLDPQMFVVLLSLAIPLGIIVGMHSVLYNGLRQFLFLIPSMILLAVYGFLQMLAFLQRKKRSVLVGLLALLAIGNTLWLAMNMLALHPYEYLYFSPLVGGVAGANGVYEMDYWNTCQRPASIWLGQHYQQFVASSTPTIQDQNIAFQYMTYLPANFQAVAHNPDFLIDIAPFMSPQNIPQYQLIHTESVEGVPLCRVYAIKSEQILRRPLSP